MVDGKFQNINQNAIKTIDSTDRVGIRFFEKKTNTADDLINSFKVYGCKQDEQQQGKQQQQQQQQENQQTVLYCN